MKVGSGKINYKWEEVSEVLYNKYLKEANPERELFGPLLRRIDLAPLTLVNTLTAAKNPKKKCRADLLDQAVNSYYW